MPAKYQVNNWSDIWSYPYNSRLGGAVLRMASPYNRLGRNEETGINWAEFDAIDEDGMTGRCRWFDYKEMIVNQRFRVKECTWRNEQRLAIGEGWGGLELVSSDPVPEDPPETSLEERVEALEEWMERVRGSFHD